MFEAPNFGMLPWSPSADSKQESGGEGTKVARWRRISSSTRSSLSQAGAGCFLKLDFTIHGPPEEQPSLRQVPPRIDGRCDTHCGVPGKILEKDVRGGQVSITPRLFFKGTFPF